MNFSRAVFFENEPNILVLIRVAMNIFAYFFPGARKSNTSDSIKGGSTLFQLKGHMCRKIFFAVPSLPKDSTCSLVCDKARSAALRATSIA